MRACRRRWSRGSLAISRRLLPDARRSCSTTSPSGTSASSLIDVHSYNHRRDGPDARRRRRTKAPDINIGTFSMPRDQWAFLRRSADRGDARVRLQRPPARRARERRLPGQGRADALRPRALSGPGCAIALEFKKFFMDEWTGEPDPAELAAMRDFIAPSSRTADGACCGMKRARCASRSRRVRARLRQARRASPDGRRRAAALHLDRWLPFLVLHRATGSVGSIARRVAVNSPAYLIWSPEDDARGRARAARRSTAAARQLRRHAGDRRRGRRAPVPSSSQDAPSLDLVVARRRLGGAGARGRGARCAGRGAAARSASTFASPDVLTAEAPPRQPPLDAVAACRRGCRWSLPQIHRARRTAASIPQLTHELAVALGDALLQAACAFMSASRAGAPAPFRSLGRSAFLAAALNADQKLDAVARSFDFLLSISPINSREARERFFADGEQQAPEFRYRPLTVDPGRRQARPLRDRPVDHRRPAARAAALAKSGGDRSPADDAGDAQHAGVQGRRRCCTTARCGRSCSTDAQAILACERAARPPAAKSVGAARSPRRRVIWSARYRPHGRVASTRTIEVRDDVAGLLVSGDKLMIAGNTAMRGARLDALLAHEVSVHLLTYFNGAAQGLTIFRTGLADYEGMQEGLGVFAEWAVGGLSPDPAAPARRPRRCGRRDACGGAEFIDVYRLLRATTASRATAAFDIATRVFRSGGFAKDAIYLEGFHAVHRPCRGRAPRWTPFWIGKIAPTMSRRSRSCCSAASSTRRLPSLVPRPADAQEPDRRGSRRHRRWTACSDWSDRLMLIAFFVNDIETRICELHDDGAGPSGGEPRAPRSATSRRPTSCSIPTTACARTSASCR